MDQAREKTMLYIHRGLHGGRGTGGNKAIIKADSGEDETGEDNQSIRGKTKTGRASTHESIRGSGNEEEEGTVKHRKTDGA